MDKRELAKLVGDLEVAINETDETIKKAWGASEFMVEPIRSDFISQLKLKEIQLNANRVMLASYKVLLVGDDKNER